MEQTTFTNYEALLRKAADVCAVDAMQLRIQVKGANERYSLALGTVADQQVRLSNTLSSYADRAPKNFLQTNLQFSPDGLENSDGVSESPGQALQRLEKHNGNLSEVFAECADAASSNEVAELLKNVCGLLEAHARNVARTMDQAKDA